ncbi:uncharacterized protein LOC119685113 [Teleopsis dalmanni]|uniref:uncharacterized protein LOC119685113 n=1 Tax=Teleopsis dalmanni TaxID=139649 RepID=UPI0018CFE9D3|nr:uncharacterized protein LOC119685113 [Teleopsis dalmanni]
MTFNLFILRKGEKILSYQRLYKQIVNVTYIEFTNNLIIILKMSVNEVSENRKCRLCGFVDVNNKNIFTGFDEDLVAKIHTVYPILLYQNDPLPQNICNKCVSTVNMQYNEVTRIVRQQKLWANNVRKQQPEHNFIKIVNFIEDASSEYQKSIKFNFDENVSTNLLNRFLLLNNAMSPTQKCDENNDVQNTTTCSTTDIASDIDDKYCLKSNSVPTTNSDDNIAENVTLPSEVIALQNVKAVLDDSDSKEDVKIQLAALNAKNTEAVNLTENLENNINENNPIDESQTNNVGVMNTDILHTFPCQYCSDSFQTNAALVIHQLKHMRLKLPKIFMKKNLSKPLRRGRLANGHRNIRCVSCWQIYSDKRAILNHWGANECEFYCAICGKEFIDKPIILKQHLLEEHGISYHSLQQQREIMKKLRSGCDYNSLKTQTKSKRSKKADTKNFISVSNCSEGSELPIKILIARAEAVKPEFLENSDGRVLCEICLHPFKSLKGRNSHMKVHKRRKDLENNVEVSEKRQTESVTDIPDKDDQPNKKLKSSNIDTNLSEVKNITINEENKNTSNEMENPPVNINSENTKISLPIDTVNSDVNESDSIKECKTVIKTESETNIKETNIKDISNKIEEKVSVIVNIPKNVNEDKEKITTTKPISCSPIAASTSPVKEQTSPIKEQACNEITRVNFINPKPPPTNPTPKIPTDNFTQNQFRISHKPSETRTEIRTESLNNNRFPHTNISPTLNTHSSIHNINFISPNDLPTITNNNQLYNLLMNNNEFSARIPESNTTYNNILYGSLVHNAANYGHVNDYTNIAHTIPSNSLGNNHLNYGCPNMLPTATNHGIPYQQMVNSNMNFATTNDMPRIIQNNHPTNSLIYNPNTHNINNYAGNLPCSAIPNTHANYPINNNMGVCATNSQIQRPITTKKCGIRTKYVEPRDKSRFPKPGETYHDNGQKFSLQQYKQQYKQQ